MSGDKDGGTRDADLLRLIFSSVTDFAVFATNCEGSVIRWNVGAERVTGFTEADMIGQTADVIFTAEDRAGGAPDAERATALSTGRSEDERWHLRKDGSRFWGSGVMMTLSSGDGFVKVVRDRTPQHESERALRESEMRFRLLATNIPQLVFRSLSTGHRTWGSPQWEIYAGLSDLDSRGVGWLDAVHPEDRDDTLEKWQDAQLTKEYYVEHRICRHADGQYRWHQTRARPVGDTGSAEWVGTSADIHELRGLQDRQQVLLAELQHRTRNLLALVQAVARQTVKSSSSFSAFLQEFDGRLAALSRVQGLLARNDHGYLQLRGLLEAELCAHDPSDGRVTIKGDDVALGPNEAQALALALHELATNAAKHGALTQPDGRLEIEWTATQEPVGNRVVLHWHETGVVLPGDVASRRRGYGRELIERALPYQMDAKTKLEFQSDSVLCAIEILIAPSGRSNERVG
jgi:PAS domain S-box-containing protein